MADGARAGMRGALRRKPVRGRCAVRHRRAAAGAPPLPPQAPADSALCLSGGGIRSATFGLGVLQALARAGVLGKLDYLSTVSGGGYVGGWFTSWLHRDGRARSAARARSGAVRRDCAARPRALSPLNGCGRPAAISRYRAAWSRPTSGRCSRRWRAIFCSTGWFSSRCSPPCCSFPACICDS